MLCMSAIKKQPKPVTSKKSLIAVGGIIAIIGLSLFAYLMWYVAPEENIELVKVIAVTEEGCIGETLDGYSVNIGECQAQPGNYINAVVDQKAKERASLMNPTN